MLDRQIDRTESLVEEQTGRHMDWASRPKMLNLFLIHLKKQNNQTALLHPILDLSEIFAIMLNVHFYASYICRIMWQKIFFFEFIYLFMFGYLLFSFIILSNNPCILLIISLNCGQTLQERDPSNLWLPLRKWELTSVSRTANNCQIPGAAVSYLSRPKQPGGPRRRPRLHASNKSKSLDIHDRRTTRLEYCTGCVHTKGLSRMLLIRQLDRLNYEIGRNIRA